MISIEEYIDKYYNVLEEDFLKIVDPSDLPPDSDDYCDFIADNPLFWDYIDKRYKQYCSINEKAL